MTRFAIALLVLAALSACNGKARQGGLEVIIATSGLQTGRDFDAIEAVVEQQSSSGGWNRLFDVPHRVPSEVTLPTTLAIEPGPSADQDARITVTGLLNGVPVVQRVVQTQVPTDRVAELVMILAGDCLDKVTLCAPESCQPLTGTCGMNVVSVTTLPTYVPGDENAVDAGGLPGSGTSAVSQFDGSPLGDDAGSPLGDDAGSPLGDDAGSALGDDSGSPLGPDAGSPLGTDSGSPLGPDAGTALGLDAGSPLGADAGSHLGVDSGSPTGQLCQNGSCSQVLDPTQPHYGQTDDEWGALWWQWLYALPQNAAAGPDGGVIAANCIIPLADPTGANCAFRQSGSVFFLAGATGGSVVRDLCVVPAGKAIFVPLVTIEADNAGVPPAMQLTAADMIAFVTTQLNGVSVASLSAEFDGVPITNLALYRTQVTKFSYTLPPEPNIFDCEGETGVTGQVDPAYEAGFYIMLAPPSPGAHVLHFTGPLWTHGLPGVMSEVTYNFTIQ